MATKMWTKSLTLILALLASGALGQGNEGQCFSSLSETLLPGGVFLNASNTQSTQSASTTQLCGSQYPGCFVANNVPYVNDPGFIVSPLSVCRVMLEYSTPAAQSSNSSVGGGTGVSSECPLPDPNDPNGCECQLTSPLLTETNGNLTFQFKMTESTCCPSCSCYGDPHCISFAGVEDDWVVCNARDPSTCAFNDTACPEAHFFVNGVRNGCRTVFDQDGNPGCEPLPSGPQPFMTMYAKNYLDPITQNSSHMSVQLQLGNLGSIVCVLATYGPNPGTASDTSYNICTPAAGGGPATSGQRLGVTQMNDFFAHTRVRVTIVVNYVGTISEQLSVNINEQDHNQFAPSGFCETGVILEKQTAVPLSSSCTPSDSFVFLRMCTMKLLGLGSCGKRAKSAKSIQSAKNSWCNKNMPSDSTCKTDPWRLSVCQKICGTIDLPCLNQCEYQLQTAPTDILSQLKTKGTKAPAAMPATPIPPTPCPAANLPTYVTSGGTQGGPMVNGKPDPSSYIYVQKQISSNPVQWSTPLLWLNRDQVACNPTIIVGMGKDTLTDRQSTFRILQCQQISTVCGANVVEADATVTWYNGAPEYVGPSSAYSKQMRQLYDAGTLICNPAQYPNCPSDYKCCVWGPDPLGNTTWKSCMTDYYPGYQTNYPNCFPS